MKTPPKAFCRHCGAPLWRRADKPSVSSGNRFTRDHIVPRRRRVPMPPCVRTIWPSCQACNEMRAVLHHCPAMLRIAADLAAAIRVKRKEAIHAFRLDGRRVFYTPAPRREHAA